MNLNALRLAVLLLAGLMALGRTFAAEALWKAGVARTIITPAESLWLAGLGFWQDILATLPPETWFDKYACYMMRLIDQGVLPHLELSPASGLNQMFLSHLSSWLPRRFFTDLKAALEAHIDFAALPQLVRPDSPVLLVGAAEVCSGQLKKFNSRLGEISVETILASAAVPTLFPAVQVGNHYYWDGLFSDNPPVKELVRMLYVGVENVPDELWVIQVNPTAVASVPKTAAEIIDRRNQMIGNVSLMQGLEFIEFWNMLLREKIVDYEALKKVGFLRRQPVIVRFIRMSPEIQSTLDYVSKLSREPAHIYRLLEDGKKQGRKFLKHLAQAGNGKPEPLPVEHFTRQSLGLPLTPKGQRSVGRAGMALETKEPKASPAHARSPN